MYAIFGNYTVSLYRLEWAYILTLVDVTWKHWAAYLTTVLRGVFVPQLSEVNIK